MIRWHSKGSRKDLQRPASERYSTSAERRRPAILFLHGIGGILKSWDKLAPLCWDRSIDIYLIDLLGHGRSDSPDIDYDVMVQVKVLKELVEQWGLERPVLFGHSYGGWMAVHYSLEKPTAGLIIEDSAGMESQQVEIRKLGKTKEDRDTLISSALLIGAHEHVVRSAADNFDKYLLTKEIMSKVSVKTSLIWGEEDEFVPVNSVRR